MTRFLMLKTLFAMTLKITRFLTISGKNFYFSQKRDQLIFHVELAASVQPSNVGRLTIYNFFSKNMLGKADYTQRVNLQIQLVDEEAGEGPRGGTLRIDRHRQVANCQVTDLSCELALAVIVPPQASSDAVSSNFAKTLAISDLINSIALKKGEIK